MSVPFVPVNPDGKLIKPSYLEEYPLARVTSTVTLPKT